MAQKYEWGWISRFPNGEAYEYAEGFTSRAQALEDVKKARAEEKRSIEEGFQTEDTAVKYTIRRRPVFTPPEWEEVAG
ncbi:hypothetical protein SEA_HORTUS1_16 [Microbacterium phage Hortus1]|nr:hypothetical protein SEA_HORTUS1_16 [Microbacterium phage Hortus1]AWY05590.1 hypothetical protein SEA_OLINDD_16 [Microbacterium phage OlinDD]AWY06349.1 hypothetical protein SEA_TANDEM_16 [Microbacterium phage Tandem]